LLAGAGIIGLAVGFGAQKLVQDIITGVFILLEDAVAVGDVVKVAGIGGLVEGLSIRSIRLRDLAGNVHTVPFSSVDTVTNMTRLFSYYLADIGVAYREDTDQVADVCRGIVEEMRSEPEFAADILEPLEGLGVDQFADSAVILKARIKTRPIRQWAVGREFNRRMKKRFDECGIEIPFPHRTLYFGTDKDGSAAPVHINAEPKINRTGSKRNVE
jgi:small conductance mechanosensitive channel